MTEQRKTQWNMSSTHDEDQKDHPANVFLAQPPCWSSSEIGASGGTGVPLSASEN